MRRVMVRYRVKPDRVEENEQLVRSVYEELHRVEPAGLRYATFLLEDGVSFVHLAESEGSQSPLPRFASFKEFQRDIEARCDESPVVTELSPIGSFRFWGDDAGGD